MKSDRKITLMIAMQMLILTSVWLGQSLPGARAAELPDPGMQRERQLEELRKINDKMDKLLDLLSNGKVQMRSPKADEK